MTTIHVPVNAPSETDARLAVTDYFRDNPLWQLDYIELGAPAQGLRPFDQVAIEVRWPVACYVLAVRYTRRPA